MKILPKKDLESFQLPLPIYATVHIAHGLSRDSEEFEILVGLDKNLVEQLKKNSLDESDIELQKTKDRMRFGEGSYEEWYEKSRTPFALVHKNTSVLAGLIWFGPKPLHDGCKCHSVGWRSYNPWRGKGLMKDFAQFSMDFYLNKLPSTGLWCKIRTDNSGSIRLAENLGFEKDEKYSKEDFIIMNKGV